MYSKLKKIYEIPGKFISFLFWYKIPSHKILQVEFQTISGLEIVFIDNKVTNNLLSLYPETNSLASLIASIYSLSSANDPKT